MEKDVCHFEPTLAPSQTPNRTTPHLTRTYWDLFQLNYYKRHESMILMLTVVGSGLQYESDFQLCLLASKMFIPRLHETRSLSIIILLTTSAYLETNGRGSLIRF